MRPSFGAESNPAARLITSQYVAEPANNANKKRAIGKLIDFDRSFISGLLGDWSRTTDRLRRSGTQSPNRQPIAAAPAAAPSPNPNLFPFPVNENQRRDSTQQGQALGSSRSGQYENFAAERFTLKFKRLELLNNNSLYVKPQLTVNVLRSDKLLFSSKFETILVRKLPTATYDLIADRPENQSVELR